MGEKAQAAVKAELLSGMVSAISPHDVPEGAGVLLLNLMVLRPGELRVRRGFRELRFDDDPD